MMTHQRLMRQLFALLKRADITSRGDRMAVASEVLHREVGSFTQLSTIELQGLVDVLEYWKREGTLNQYCRTAVNKAAREDA